MSHDQYEEIKKILPDYVHEVLGIEYELIISTEETAYHCTFFFDVYKDGMNKEEAAAAACDAVRQLSIRVGIPQHLSEIGIKEEDLPKLAKSAFADVCTPGNPREVTEEIILDLYKKVL